MVASRPERSDADLVRAASDHDPTAFGELFERWFDRVYDVARNIVRNDDTAAEVAQDVFLTTWQRLDQLDDPERFGGWLLRASRNRALNRLEKERRAQPLDGQIVTGIHEGQHGGEADRDDLLGSNRRLETEAISDARDQQSLVWAAAAALGPRDASLLDLQLRHQLSPGEIADELDLTANNAHQLLFRLRNKLGEAVANHQLWRGGAPRCSELAALVDDDDFDATVNKIVQRHSARCDTCGPERKRVVDPTKLFASVPIAIAPMVVRERVAAALAGEGVPAQGTGDGEPDTSADESEAGEPDNAELHRGGPDRDEPASDTPASTASAKAEQPLLTASTEFDGPTPDHVKWKRRAGLVLIAAAVLIGVVAVFGQPAGNPEVTEIASPVTSEAAGDSVGTSERSIVQPSTTATTLLETTLPETSTSTSPPTDPPPPTSPPTDPPPVDPPPTDPPPTDPPPTDPPPTDPPPTDPPPVIVRFILSAPPGAIFCPEPTDTARTARWFVEEATSVSITTPNGTTAREPSATHTFCAPSGSTITLTATGPGGTVTDTETVS